MERHAVYIINFFKSDEKVVSERFVGKLAMARERADRAVADGTAERAQIRDGGKSGEVIYRSTLSGGEWNDECGSGTKRSDHPVLLLLPTASVVSQISELADCFAI
jgi:hypothetical protein